MPPGLLAPFNLELIISYAPIGLSAVPALGRTGPV